MSKAVKYDTLFSNVFLRYGKPVKFPYKTHVLLKLLHTNTLPRSALGRVLRFWTTPNRKRFCSCGDNTVNLSHHLLFKCRKTQDKVLRYLSALRNPALVPLFSPCDLVSFAREISRNDKTLKRFNLMLGQLDYPRF